MIRNVAALICALMATAAAAKDVQGWEVTGDKSGCYMMASFTGGSSLLMMLPIEDESAVFMISNAKWKGIRKGREYKLKIEFDNLGEWNPTANGSVIELEAGPDEGALSWFSSTEANAEGDNFVSEFALASTVTIKRDNGTVVDQLSLKGTRAAVLETIRCRSILRRGDFDPFGDGAPTPSRKPDAPQTI